ncbi:MAG TPA: HD-GYP domain-containing protein [Ktedonobacteraceae bacterium]|nr:HD-GYP domain-containing protein [Ktedonobacteraceae bacterium]
MNTQLHSIIHAHTSEYEHPLLLKLHALEELQQHERQQQFSEVLSALVSALKAKDPQLYKHSYRVQHFTRHITHTLHLPEDEARTIKLAALFHDIGKIGTQDRILGKSSRLTKREFEKIKEHPLRGALILGQSELLNNVIPAVYCHHERWDGEGYPNGLQGESIPFGARIVAIADAFEAMTSSQRSYQIPRSPLEALEELRRCAGTQFDPTLVDIFCLSLEADLLTPLNTLGLMLR